MAGARLSTVLIFVALGIAGCSSGQVAPKGNEKPLKGVEIVVSGPVEPGLLEAVDAQRGEWEESRGAKVSLRRETAKDLKTLSGADVILFPGDRLGDLVDAGLLAALPDTLVKPLAAPVKEDTGQETAPPPSDPLAFADVVPPYQDLVGNYGRDRMALPLGGSALVVVYRRDAFEGAANRKAAEEAGLTLEPPTTWEQFDALAKFFHGRDWDGDGEAESGVALAWAADPEGVGDATFLARAAALGLHKDQFGLLFDSDQLVPRLDSPPFVESLKGLVALRAFGPRPGETFDAEAARAAFRTGEAAMLIDRAERSAMWNDPKAPRPIGIAPLPGSKRVYNPERKTWEEGEQNRASYLPRGGGWLIGVSASATGPKKEAALDFLSYLAGPDTSARLLADRGFPMLPIRSAQIGSGPSDPRSTAGIEPKTWSDAISKTWLAPRVAVGLRIPSADGYLADLAAARVRALSGEPADEALKQAAKAWAERSKPLGEDRQLWHYRRSLNRLSTSPRPPDR